MSEFERKFGEEFLATVPLLPGVYRFIDRSGQVAYVGKAIRLRRRLQQYKNAGRLKRHRKMRKILREGVRIEFEVCASHREACLRELELIQSLRPRLNVSAAFSFLYPMIGVDYDERTARLVLSLTHKPELVVGAGGVGTSWHGAFRSRSWTREFFWTLVELLEFTAHRSRTQVQQKRIRGVSSAAFRQVSAEWVMGLQEFLRGCRGSDFLELWILQLVENAGARSRSAAIQDQLKALRLFYRHECQGLLKARQLSGHAAYPVAQADRDRIFLEARLVGEPGSGGALKAQEPLDAGDVQHPDRALEPR